MALSRRAAMGAACDSEVCLSFSCRDLREYRHTFPSWLMLQAYRAVSVLHDLYALLLRKCRNERRRPKIATDLEWFLAQGRDALSRLHKETPPSECLTCFGIRRICHTQVACGKSKVATTPLAVT